MFVFTPRCPNPVYSSKKLLENKGKVLAACFAPSPYGNDTNLQWYMRSSLYFLDSNKELYKIGETEEKTGPSQFLSENVANPNLLNLALPKMSATTMKATTPFSHLYSSKQKQKLLEDVSVSGILFFHYTFQNEVLKSILFHFINCDMNFISVAAVTCSYHDSNHIFMWSHSGFNGAL